MKTPSFLTILSCLAPVIHGHAAAPLVCDGPAGPGKERHIVFLARDPDYHSEETLPAPARLDAPIFPAEKPLAAPKKKK